MLWDNVCIWMHVYVISSFLRVMIGRRLFSALPHLVQDRNSCYGDSYNECMWQSYSNHRHCISSPCFWCTKDLDGLACTYNSPLSQLHLGLGLITSHSTREPSCGKELAAELFPYLVILCTLYSMVLLCSRWSWFNFMLLAACRKRV